MAKQKRATALSSSEDCRMRVLRVLLVATTPMSTSELGRKAGLFSGELKTTCRSLLDLDLVRFRHKVDKVVVWNRTRFRPVRYWEITDQGRQFPLATSSSVTGDAP